MCSKAGFDSLARRNDGEAMELNRDMSLDEVDVESPLR
jgi:hypothetical protein